MVWLRAWTDVASPVINRPLVQAVTPPSPGTDGISGSEEEVAIKKRAWDGFKMGFKTKPLFMVTFVLEILFHKGKTIEDGPNCRLCIGWFKSAA